MADHDDLISTLRTILPPQAQHLAEPLAHYLKAAEALAIAVDTPEAGRAVTAALTELSQGGLINMSSATIAGGVQIGHAAGGNIFNLTINALAEASIAPAKLTKAQQQLLVTANRLVRFNDRDMGSEEIAEYLRWEHSDTIDELAFLTNLDLIEVTQQKINGSLYIRLTAEGRRIVRNLT